MHNKSKQNIFWIFNHIIYLLFTSLGNHGKSCYTGQQDTTTEEALGKVPDICLLVESWAKHLCF